MEAALCVLESKQVVGQPVNITSIKYTCFLATSIVSCIICVKYSLVSIQKFRYKNQRRSKRFPVPCFLSRRGRASANDRIYSPDGGPAIFGIRSGVKGSPRQVLTFPMRSKGKVARNGKDGACWPKGEGVTESGREEAKVVSP